MSSVAKQRILMHAIGAFISVAFIAPTMWLLFDRSPPYIMVGGTIVPDRPKPGEKITVTWSIRQLRACPASVHSSVTRAIVDSKGVKHSYAPVRAVYDSLTLDTSIIRLVDLPANIPPGPARYNSVACYPCNPVQEYWPVCIETPTIFFEVGEPDPT